MYQWDVLAVTNNLNLFLIGIKITLYYTIITSLISFGLGLIFALCRLSHIWLLRKLIGAIVEVIRGLPLIVVLIWFFYALPILTGAKLTISQSAIIGLSLYGSTFYAEIIRGGILSIESGQTEAALSLGMTYSEIMRRIIVPQATRRTVPSLMNQTIIQLKNTSIASVITAPELVYQAQFISSFTYRPLEVYTAVGFIYLLIIFPATLISRRLEIKKGEI